MWSTLFTVTFVVSVALSLAAIVIDSVKGVSFVFDFCSLRGNLGDLLGRPSFLQEVTVRACAPDVTATLATKDC